MGMFAELSRFQLQRSRCERCTSTSSSPTFPLELFGKRQIRKCSENRELQRAQQLPWIQKNFKILPEFVYTVPSPSQRTSCTPSPLPQPTQDFQFFRVIAFALLLMPLLSWKHWSVKLSRVPRSRYICYSDPVASVRTLLLGDLCGFC